ncbi:MAG: 3-(cis-5,6-dihydroxycyclohexa-1,3-dien-1-yl)propanoate dehydrogenase [Chloroflexi bacterium]|nr:3-(cis-5,6-dihydroxycyclohexa-1,3-dien-1-yl)propanoate dehydrogenase [Chloroflexota bacterium]
MGWLDGKVALVTGASTGIGRALVERFVAEGACVTAMARSRDKLETLAGERILAYPGDVTSLDDNLAAVQATVDRFGKLDCFVANAGLFDCFAHLPDIPLDTLGKAFDELFAVNVKGGLFGAKAALPHLQAVRGSLIFTISNAGFYPAGGGPLYTASKHAVVGLVRQLACELAPDVRVNAVAPGGTSSEITGPPSLAEFCAGKQGPQRAELIRHRNPLRLVQDPEDHTAAYVLLASDQARAMTGAIIESDGGIGVRGVPRYD